MKYIISIVTMTLFLFSCNTYQEDTDKSNKSMDSMPRVTGIGGIFIASENPQEMKDWYAKQLGLVVNEYGSTFESRNANRPKEINYLQWNMFTKDNVYFTPSQKGFIINYRVQHLDILVKNLKSNGVNVLDEIQTYNYGKFVHIMDPEGNKIELWEPIDSVLTLTGSKTTK